MHDKIIWLEWTLLTIYTLLGPASIHCQWWSPNTHYHIWKKWRHWQEIDTQKNQTIRSIKMSKIKLNNKMNPLEQNKIEQQNESSVRYWLVLLCSCFIGRKSTVFMFHRSKLNYLEVLSKINGWIFFIFCMISGCRLTLLVTELGFSGEKNRGLGFLGQNGLNWTQIKAFTVLSKINAWRFFDYVHDVTLIQKLKIYSNGFQWKKFCWSL